MELTEDQSPPLWKWLLSFILVGAAWGFTTPFMRRAALAKDSKPRPIRSVPDDRKVPLLKRKVLDLTASVVDLVRNPAYAVPLLFNITGSIWFFLLIGQAELSLTVPIVNSLAFLFTVLGEWLAEAKTITKGTWIGMILVLSGIGLCVYSKIS